MHGKTLFYRSFLEFHIPFNVIYFDPTQSDRRVSGVRAVRPLKTRATFSEPITDSNTLLPGATNAPKQRSNEVRCFGCASGGPCVLDCSDEEFGCSPTRTVGADHTAIP